MLKHIAPPGQELGGTAAEDALTLLAAELGIPEDCVERAVAQVVSERGHTRSAMLSVVRRWALRTAVVGLGAMMVCLYLTPRVHTQKQTLVSTSRGFGDSLAAAISAPSNTYLAPIPIAGLDHNLRALNYSIATSITFVNRLDHSVSAYRVDLDGRRRYCGDLTAGQTSTYDTCFTWPWLIVDKRRGTTDVYLPAGFPSTAYLGGTVAGSAPASLDVAGTGRSLSRQLTGVTTSAIEFVNRFDHPVGLYRVDAGNHIEWICNVDPNDTYYAATPAVDLWIVADGQGHEVARFSPDSHPRIAVVGAEG